MHPDDIRRILERLTLGAGFFTMEPHFTLIPPEARDHTWALPADAPPMWAIAISISVAPLGTPQRPALDPQSFESVQAVYSTLIMSTLSRQKVVFPFSEITSKKQLLDFVRAALLTMLEHELDEAFTYRGQQVRDPHGT